MTPERLLVVLDTQVWVDIYLRLAILDPSQPYAAIFDALTDDEFVPVYSRPTLDELKRILTTSPDVAQYYRIDAADAVEFIESIFYGVGEFVEITGTLHVSSDVDDDMFVETAIAARAHVLVAENRDLHEPAVRRLLHGHRVAVLYPKQFRKLLAKRRAGAPAPEGSP